MAIHLRQVCLLADALAPAIADLSAVFSLPACFIDPEVGKFGLQNTLLTVGSQFIEVVAPIRENTPAGRFLERRGGNGGYMVICQITSLSEQAELRARAMASGVRIAFESNRDSWNILQLHPADMGAAFFEIDWDHEADVSGNWHPAGGTGWRAVESTAVISAITAVELQSADPQALAQRWAVVAGVPVEERSGVLNVPLANVNLRFVEARDGRGPGLGGLDVRVVDRSRLLRQAAARGISVVDDHLMICGTRFYLIS